ncbi:nucleotidyl transferase AbiEii/AbiGii toxin family protein [Mesorhizobium sp. IMUNJ 23232]|uniref:nucleotidyl transferase AbiEii/AbiGii toxin family protein n=1 Tax=Mesorhizobium sp. IMUNJ 23232 TaxID=3376064 RepID=UPI0037BCD8B5
MPFIRPEHKIIADMLRRMNRQVLTETRCWFGGGTAVVLLYGEYRRSLDVDFLCADVDGYREIRNIVVAGGQRTLFGDGVASVREARADAYGVRMFLEQVGQPIKFEIIRKARIALSGAVDDRLGVPVLSAADMFAEKLLANADRCMDRSVAYRDAIDLGRLIEVHGRIPDTALEKAIQAYGEDIERKAVWVVNRLADDNELREIAVALQMDRAVATSAISAFRAECRRIWPHAAIDGESVGQPLV